MKHSYLPLFAVTLLTAALSPQRASAASVPIGYISYDAVTSTTAEFDISNFTGLNSLAPDFPVVTPLSLSNLSLTVSYLGGQTKTFGSSYFTLAPDGLSFTGTPYSTLAGYPAGFNGAIAATLTGKVNLSSIHLADNTQTLVQPTFSTTISDPGGLVDGDFATMNLTITPEPGTWLLCATGLAAVLLFQRKALALRLRSGAPNASFIARAGISCLLVFAAARTSSAAVTLSAWTSPNSGAAGTTDVNITGSGFPSGTIPAGNVTVMVAPACGASGSTAQVNSVTKIIGSTERVQFVIPALATGTYYVSLAGTTSASTAFASGNCAQVSVTSSAPVATLSASSVSFASLTAGSSSPAQTVTLSNTGTATLNLNLSGFALSGTGANLFSQSNNCPTALMVGAYCTITMSFSPKVPGSYSATLNIADNASPNTQTVSLSGTATPFALTIDASNPNDWKINNGAVSLDFSPSKNRIFHIFLAGYSDDLVDNTANAPGIYMDNTGVGGGAVTSGFVNAGSYIDWWVSSASTATTGWSGSMHFFVYPNDPGIHTYFVANHSAIDPATSIGQIQWVYRSNLNQFNNTYSVNPDLSNPGPVKIQLPPSNIMFPSDPGRAVQDATADLHGLALPPSFTRQFYTKYDYSSYNYLHQAHGTFGSTYGVWTYIPSNESLVAGPTKQNLIFTGNLLMMEAFSNHLDNGLSLTPPAGVAVSRLFGPYYFHFNTYSSAYSATGSPINTPDDMYADTLAAGASFIPQYDAQTTLIQNGYVASTQRGSVSVQIPNVPALTGATPKKAWAVLSDPGKNQQFSSAGYQYWADISQTGSATINGVVPGTYRLSVYVLGQFGELRQDGISVTANATTTVPAVNFVPENFGAETVFTIGTPDRSSHEFLHGHDAQGHDDREFWGNWNYWADFAANNGAVVYNATSGPAGPATNDLSKWNYNHWGSSFDPGLFAGVYNASDDTTDGYIYAIPPYVATLPGTKGTNGVTTPVPAWTVHFASPADVTNYQPGGYAILSVGVACAEGSYVVTLNGTTRVWGFSKASDCAIRSGLSGYYQFVAMQFPASALNGAGQDNVMTISVSQTQGVMDDALRLELSMSDASTATTGWHDYEYTNSNSSSQTIRANDAVPNP